MDVALTLKNYRCFQDAKPARIILRSGFTSFVGINNAGKSSLLKFFHEFRPLFELLSNPTGNLTAALYKPQPSIGYSPSVKDRDEIFCNLNDRDLTLERVKKGLAVG